MTASVAQAVTSTTGIAALVLPKTDAASDNSSFDALVTAFFAEDDASDASPDADAVPAETPGSQTNTAIAGSSGAAANMAAAILSQGSQVLSEAAIDAVGIAAPLATQTVQSTDDTAHDPTTVTGDDPIPLLTENQAQQPNQAQPSSKQANSILVSQPVAPSPDEDDGAGAPDLSFDAQSDAADSSEPASTVSQTQSQTSSQSVAQETHAAETEAAPPIAQSDTADNTEPVSTVSQPQTPSQRGAQETQGAEAEAALPVTQSDSETVAAQAPSISAPQSSVSATHVQTAATAASTVQDNTSVPVATAAQSGSQTPIGQDRHAALRVRAASAYADAAALSRTAADGDTPDQTADDDGVSVALSTSAIQQASQSSSQPVQAATSAAPPNSNAGDAGNDSSDNDAHSASAAVPASDSANNVENRTFVTSGDTSSKPAKIAQSQDEDKTPAADAVASPPSSDITAIIAGAPVQPQPQDTTDVENGNPSATQPIAAISTPATDANSGAAIFRTVGLSTEALATPISGTAAPSPPPAGDTAQHSAPVASGLSPATNAATANTVSANTTQASERPKSNAQSNSASTNSVQAQSPSDRTSSTDRASNESKETAPQDASRPPPPSHSANEQASSPPTPVPQIASTPAIHIQSAVSIDSAPPASGVFVPVSADSAANAPVHLELTMVAGLPDAAADMDSLALRIAAKSNDGDSAFTIRLDPPDLGRIEISLNVNAQGHAEASLSADKPQTLDLLQRDAPALERALKDAGIDVSGGLSFSLKSDGQQGDPRDSQGSDRGKPMQIAAIEAGNANAAGAVSSAIATTHWGGDSARLDIII